MMISAALLAMALAGPTASAPPRLIAESASSVSPRPVRIATLAPLRADQVRSVLRIQVRKWLGPSGRMRAGLAFSPDGRVEDGYCDPAACQGRYRVEGNRVSIDWGGRSPRLLLFYRAQDGTVYAADGDRRDGSAMPW